MNLAVRNLLQDKLRFFLSVVGVALPVMLILFLLGLREGVFQSSVVYLDHAPGSIAVMPAGVTSSHGHGQFLRAETVEAVAATRGVARAIPIMITMLPLDLHGKKELIQLVGYDADLGGGPWSLAKGRVPAADGEVVLDRSLADRHGIRVGASLQIGGQQMTVVGLSNQTATFLGAYAFARRSFVGTLALAPGGASYIVVTPSPGTARSDLIAGLQTITGTSVLPKSQVMANDRAIMAQVIDQMVYLMVVAAFIVGALVVGMVIYTATIERRGEYGILKAIGGRNGVLYRIVASQALIAAIAGSSLGMGLAYVAGSLVTNVKPQFLVSIQPTAIFITLAAGLVMALAGALLPARAVAGMAPAEVFRR